MNLLIKRGRVGINASVMCVRSSRITRGSLAIAMGAPIFFVLCRPTGDSPVAAYLTELMLFKNEWMCLIRLHTPQTNQTLFTFEQHQPCLTEATIISMS